MTISSAGMKTTLRFPLLAEALGCMTEQMAYIHIGLPAATPRPERVRQLVPSSPQADRPPCLTR